MYTEGQCLQSCGTNTWLRQWHRWEGTKASWGRPLLSKGRVESWPKWHSYILGPWLEASKIRFSLMTALIRNSFSRPTCLIKESQAGWERPVLMKIIQSWNLMTAQSIWCLAKLKQWNPPSATRLPFLLRIRAYWPTLTGPRLAEVTWQG